MELAEVGALTRRDDGRFTIGLRLWQLGTLAPLTESLRTTAQPFMEDLFRCTARASERSFWPMAAPI
jgi:DNA-binding IclR family transcriptional regulator